VSNFESLFLYRKTQWKLGEFRHTAIFPLFSTGVMFSDFFLICDHYLPEGCVKPGTSKLLTTQ